MKLTPDGSHEAVEDEMKSEVEIARKMEKPRRRTEADASISRGLEKQR